MIAVLWTYDGWYCLTFAAGELREPARTLPIGLVAGNLLVVALYLVVQLAYFRALPLEILAATPRTGEAAALALFGAAGGRAITLAILITILGCLAGTILTSSRIYLAMAADGLFFAALARVDPRRRIPARALWAQSLWAVALALSGTFERLYTWVVFTGLLLHLAAAAGVFALRRRRPEQARPFRVPLLALADGRLPRRARAAGREHLRRPPGGGRGRDRPDRRGASGLPALAQEGRKPRAGGGTGQKRPVTPRVKLRPGDSSAALSAAPKYSSSSALRTIRRSSTASVRRKPPPRSTSV